MYAQAPQGARDINLRTCTTRRNSAVHNLYSLILQSAACTKTISAQKSFAPMKNLTSLLYGELLPRSPKMAVPKARKKGIIDFFYFSQPEDETVLWDRQIMKLNTYSSPETSGLDQKRRSL